jgi:hypothetical protein
MSLISLHSDRPTTRGLALCCIVALIATLTPASALAESSSSSSAAPNEKRNAQRAVLQEVSQEALATCESAPQAPAAGQCGMPVDLSAPGARGEQRDKRPVVRASQPGEWRRDLKSQAPTERLPGQVVSPRGPVPGEVSTEGRWLRGYTPNTPRAQREFQQWNEEQRLRQAGRAGLEPKASSGSAPQNIWSAGISDGGPDEYNADEEPITSLRVELSTPASVVVPTDLEPIEETGKMNGGPSQYHSSGLTVAEYNRLKDLALTTPPTPDAQEATVNLSRAAVSQGVSFDAIGPGGSVPPDAIMAAGPNHLVGIVNTAYQVFDKTGAPLTARTTLNTFFSGITGCIGSFDPFIAYDEEMDRFVMGSETIQGNGDSYICLAASQTNNPAGAWHRYSFRNDTLFPGEHIDYPHMAIGLDAVVIAGNNFGDGGGGFARILAMAVGKTELYAGDPLVVNFANLGAAFFTGQPAKLHGFNTGQWPAPGSPSYIIGHNLAGSTRIWTWDDAVNTAPVIFGTVAETFLGAPPNALDGTDGSANDRNDTDNGRWFDAEYRDGRIYASRAVNCNIGGGFSEACVDWVVIDVSGGTPSLIEQQSGGAFGTANEFRYHPDIGVDRNGNVLVGYTKSSENPPDGYTAVWVAGREVGDPLGTLQPEILVRQGLGTYVDGAGCGGACDRWGDYTGMTIDPDGCTFWYMGQFSDGGVANWDTRIANFKFDSCSVESAIGVDKGVYTCSDEVTITVQDITRISASTVSAQTEISTSTGDMETVLAGGWNGSDCIGSDCRIWTTTLPTSDSVGSNDDGVLNVANGGAITTTYNDPHPSHTDQMRTVLVDCQTQFDDGGFLVDGGCELGTGGEFYRDYLDAGEQIAYTVGLFNPASARPLSDVSVSLNIVGPAAGEITVHNPTVYIGAVDQNSLGGAVFNLSVSDAVDSPAFRLSEHTFEFSVTSIGDGYTVPQLVEQLQLLQADDNIVTLEECFTAESDEGFVNERYVFDYVCDANSTPPCTPSRTVNTVTAPWSRGTGCFSETRTDVPDSNCDVGGTNAYKSNSPAGSCADFTESGSTLTDDVLFTPIFGPANTGNAGNGQPWNFQWLFAEWYRLSEGLDPMGNAAAVHGEFFSPDYAGVANPEENEIDAYYPFFTGYSVYGNVGWDSATPFDPNDPPANLDGVSFDGLAAGGLAEADTAWRMAFEVFDGDFGGDPQATPPVAGQALDNIRLAYDQFHAEEQIGVCTGAAATVSFDQFTYRNCRTGVMELQVLDPDATGPLTVTVTSDDTEDSETVTLTGSAPYFTGLLGYDTASGEGVDDGVLFVTPSDLARVVYDDVSTATQVENAAGIVCSGGAVVIDAITGFQDNGDDDPYADTNETIELALRLANNGLADVSNATVRLATDSPFIDCIQNDIVSFGTIAANGGTAENSLAVNPFRFKVAPTAECVDPSFPPTADFTLFITGDGFDGSTLAQKITLRLDLNDIGSVNVLSENFDAGQGGFTHELGEGDDDGNSQSPDGNACSPYVDEAFWAGGGGNPAGAFFVYDQASGSFPGGDYADLLDSEIISPVIVVPAGGTSALVTFDHSYLFQSTSTLLPDGARVDYRVNGGPWTKVTTLPYDGPLIFNSYCNPLCNNLGEVECFSENGSNGEQVFALLNSAVQPWTTVQGTIPGLAAGDELEVRWRVGSMNLTFFGFPKTGGYALDNVTVSAEQQECDAAINPDDGCGVVFSSAGNLVQVCGNDNDVIEPTEIWSVDVQLKNVGSGPAEATVADLDIAALSTVGGTVLNPNGSFGTIAPDGFGMFTYDFEVEDPADCLEDITFDVINVADMVKVYPDTPSAFAVQVGELNGDESATQATDPISAASSMNDSDLSPAFTLAAADTATLSYSFNYDNSAPSENASQDSSLTNVANGTDSSTLSPAFTVTAISASTAQLSYNLSYAGNLTRCTQVALRTPNATDVVLKDFDVANASPYDVLSIYQGADGGPGQYSIVLSERSGGGCNDPASLTGTNMSVFGSPTSGNWTDDVQVSLFDGTSSAVLKPFGVADANPYDVTSIYNLAGAGTYTIEIEEAGGGGTAELSSAAMGVFDEQCDQGCSGFAPAPPPVADGVVGTAMTVNPGVGPDDLIFDIDNATCSEDHAVVLYGNIGDYSSYIGAIDVGCDLGDGQNALATHVGSDVWFNVIWVSADDVGGNPGFASSGERTWNATGLCNVTNDDTSDDVCN